MISGQPRQVIFNGVTTAVNFCINFYGPATGYIKITKVNSQGVKSTLACIPINGSNDYCVSDETYACGSTYTIEYLASC
jgi:hypothetical protein